MDNFYLNSFIKFNHLKKKNLKFNKLIIFFFIIYIFVTENYLSIIFAIIFSSLGTFIFNRFKFNIFKKELFFYNLYYFLIIIFFSKIIYWTDLQSFINYQITPESSHYAYGLYIELILLIIMFVTFFSLNYVFQYLNHNKKNEDFLTPLILFILSIFFIIESFSTYGFFEDSLGHSKVHWQTYIGPVELMLQGGYLLWDTPSQYGFLSTILIYLMPFDDPWMKFYYLNALLTFIFSLMMFLTIWNRGSLTWLFISFLITYSAVFLLPGGQWQYNVASTPSSGMMRFFVSILLLFLLFVLNKSPWNKQILTITPIWLIGTLWSFESAFYCSCLILPWVISNLVSNKNSNNQKILSLVIFPLTFLITVGLISIYYLIKIGNLPDYYAYAEYALSWTSGHANILIDTQSTFITWLLIMSLLLSIFKYVKNKNIFLCSIFLLLSYITYFITRGSDIVIVSQLKMYFFILFINLNLINQTNYIKSINKFSPVFIFTIIFGFCNPSIINHFNKTINSQDYLLTKVEMENTNQFNYLHDQILVYNYPINYIQEGRYLNTFFYNSVNSRNWLPVHPASLFQPLKENRIKKYINRWLEKREINEGWLIYDPASHWNYRIIKSIRSALMNYQIVKTINHKNLRAELLQKK